MTLVASLPFLPRGWPLAAWSAIGRSANAMEIDA